jgi:hypothetical protein
MTGIDSHQPSINGTLVEKFAAQRNVAHFQELLRNEPDASERRILESMLREERIKLAAAEAAPHAQDRSRLFKDIAPAKC